VARLNPDTVILDLEDGVDVSQKETARQAVVAALADLDFGHTERLVRINAPDTPFFTADLEAMASTDVVGIVIPKVESAAQLHSIDKVLSALEQATPAGSIRLFALIETTLGLMNIREIARGCERLDGLFFGAEDLAADLGVSRSQDGWETFHGRNVVVTAAAAYGLWAIDTIFTGVAGDPKDIADLEEDALFARQLGYDGKMAIHPNQIEVIQRVFSPTAEDIARARQLLEAYRVHQAAGTGVFTLNGRMVDKPVVRSAQQILERARLCGLVDE